MEASKKSAMVFAPHQDDETFGCGGMIALKRAQGVTVKVVFMTDGRNGSNQPLTSEEIIKVRKREAIDALSILGVDEPDIYFLDEPDGTLGNMRKIDYRRTIDNLLDLLKTYSPEECLLPYQNDCHKDHESTYTMVRTAIDESGLQANVLQYPVRIFWQKPLLFTLKKEKLEGTYRLSVKSVLKKKKLAIKKYRSQANILTHGFILQFYTPYEIYFIV